MLLNKLSTKRTSDRPPSAAVNVPTTTSKKLTKMFSDEGQVRANVPHLRVRDVHHREENLDQRYHGHGRKECYGESVLDMSKIKPGPVAYVDRIEPYLEHF